MSFSILARRLAADFQKQGAFADIAADPRSAMSANFQAAEINNKSERPGPSKGHSPPAFDEKTDPPKAAPVLDLALDEAGPPDFADIAARALRESLPFSLSFISPYPLFSFSLPRAGAAMSAKLLPAILPDACPCWEWLWTPGIERACAFGKELLQRLAAAGAVPDDEGRCPLLGACKLICLLPNKQKETDNANR